MLAKGLCLSIPADGSRHNRLPPPSGASRCPKPTIPRLPDGAERTPRGALSIRTLCMPADTQSPGRHLRRLAARTDGHRRRHLRLRDFRWALRHRRGPCHDIQEAGSGRRRDVNLYGSHPHRHDVHHGACGGLGAPPQPGAARPRHRRHVHLRGARRGPQAAQDCAGLKRKRSVGGSRYAPNRG
jgi:hypothetical protein